jgi:hypothetical protein
VLYDELVPEMSDDDFRERIAYVQCAFRNKKSEVDSSRLADALLTTFQEGYNGNHQPFPKNSLTLHRGRIAAGGQPFPRLTDHWYPPTRYSTYNRANLPGEGVFYCSNRNGTSLLELRPKAGNVISMMTCQISKHPILLKWISQTDLFGLHELAGRSGEFERLCSEIYSHGAASPQQYMITGAYGSLFFRLDFIDGLAYSSIATECKGVNVALRGSVADQYVQPLSFRAFLVTDASRPFDFRVRCIAAAGAPAEAGEIAWEQGTHCEGHIVNGSIFERPGATTIAQTNCRGLDRDYASPRPGG